MSSIRGPIADQGLAAPARYRKNSPVVVVGGSGFIGSNVAESFLRDGGDVVIVDNLSRPGVEQNLKWLQESYGDRVHPVIADIRKPGEIDTVFKDAYAVFQFAAQTAVTTSLVDPVGDFETNARGTLNVLEAVRAAGRNAAVIFASTNKVYGDLSDLKMTELDELFIPCDEGIRTCGIDEKRRLDFCTPYGCSKGVADQYVLDYAKSFGLPTAVLRMSCIYGPRQFGTEDQGWVAHFLISALRGETISIFGNGKQVRDILHVGDAVAAYRSVLGNIAQLKGSAFNLGGGPHNAVSIHLVLREVERLVGRPIVVEYAGWRSGDQSYFVADTRLLYEMVGWRPRIGWRDGVRDLYDWLSEYRVDGAQQRARRASA